MAEKNKKTKKKHIRSEGSYSSNELKFLTMEDGTRVVTSADGDIKRPVCAGIDVHKEILMTAVCKTDTETLTSLPQTGENINGGEKLFREINFQIFFNVVK